MSTSGSRAREAASGGHQRLFYALCDELKALTRTPDHGFKRSVSVAAIIDLECRYAEAETEMMNRAIADLHSRAGATK